MQARTTTMLTALGISIALIVLSLVGALGPMENALRFPMVFLQDVLGTETIDLANFSAELAEIRTLRERNQQLEAALANYQSELAELRAYRADYERLEELVNYVGQTGQDWRYVTADVIGRDVTGVVRTIQISAGTRHGVEIGDPVVTAEGLVGRIMRVSATGSVVLLITDQNSSINAIVQNQSREQGLLRGSLSGELLLDFVDVDGEIGVDQQVYTSGETQNFPPNILMGQIRSVRLSQDELFRQGVVRSFVDFEHLVFVLVITNWDPVELDNVPEAP